MPNTNNTPVSREELEKVILKQSLVQAEVIRWEKKSNQPIEQSHQAICEIGIDDLMKIIDSYFKAFADEVERELEKKPDNPANSQHYCYNDAVDDFKLALKDLLEKWGVDG